MNELLRCRTPVLYFVPSLVGALALLLIFALSAQLTPLKLAIAGTLAVLTLGSAVGAVIQTRQERADGEASSEDDETSGETSTE